jgi:hypothetical protein
VCQPRQATCVVTEHSDVTETTAGRCFPKLWMLALPLSDYEVTGYQPHSWGSIPDRGNIFSLRQYL